MNMKTERMSEMIETSAKQRGKSNDSTATENNTACNAILYRVHRIYSALRPSDLCSSICLASLNPNEHFLIYYSVKAFI